MTERLVAARLWAVNRLPYLASALFACELRAAPGSGTIAVDRGWTVRADPAVVERFTVPELGRLLVHLVGHLLREHGDRAQALAVGRERRAQWQACADAEINDDLAATGDRPPLADTLPSTLGQPDGRLAETYYAARPDVDRVDWDCGSGSDGLPRPGEQPALTPTQAQSVRTAVARAVREAEAQRPGTVPAGWRRWAEALLPSRTDWRRVLAAELRSALAAVTGSVDYSYRRLSRRTHADTTVPRPVLPALIRPHPTVAVVLDTSGSMDDQLIAAALAEVEALLVRVGLRTTGLTVLAVDTEVHARSRVRRAADVQLAGGGGTDMGAGLTAAAALRPRPDLVVVLTDGWTPWPDCPPPATRVVVGLLRHPGQDEPSTPQWARTVVIDPADLGRP